MTNEKINALIERKAEQHRQKCIRAGVARDLEHHYTQGARDFIEIGKAMGCMEGLIRAFEMCPGRQDRGHKKNIGDAYCDAESELARLIGKGE